MSVQITHTVNMGDGTFQVFGRRPGGLAAHVVVGLDKMADGSVYGMLELACAKLDKKAADLDRQSTLDSEADT